MKYRIMILEDQCEYMYGDFDDKEKVDRIINMYGVWGYVVEQWVEASEPCVTCKHFTPAQWEHVDSCFGYLGNDRKYMLECARAALPEGVDALLVDEHGNEI